MHFTLEKYKIFPIVAWTLVIGFVFFTYLLTIRLTEATNGPAQHTQATLDALEATN